MKTCCGTNSCRRPLNFVAALAVLALLTAAGLGTTRADFGIGGDQVYRVEEDWTLVVNEPNSLVASPQVSTQMARSTTTQRFCNFHVNSRDVPSFQLGGLQLQAWYGSTNTAALNSNTAAVMGTSNEMVTWTQYLRRDSNNLYFGIGTVQTGVQASSSTTWGDFSGVETPVPAGSVKLDGYDPVYTQQNSGVTFGANRVQAFVLTQVRWYDSSNNLIQSDFTPRIIYSQTLDPALNPTGTPGN